MHLCYSPRLYRPHVSIAFVPSRSVYRDCSQFNILTRALRRMKGVLPPPLILSMLSFVEFWDSSLLGFLSALLVWLGLGFRVFAAYCPRCVLSQHTWYTFKKRRYCMYAYLLPASAFLLSLFLICVLFSCGCFPFDHRVVEQQHPPVLGRGCLRPVQGGGSTRGELFGLCAFTCRKALFAPVDGFE